MESELRIYLGNLSDRKIICCGELIRSLGLTPENEEPRFPFVVDSSKIFYTIQSEQIALELKFKFEDTENTACVGLRTWKSSDLNQHRNFYIETSNEKGIMRYFLKPGEWPEVSETEQDDENFVLGQFSEGRTSNFDGVSLRVDVLEPGGYSPEATKMLVQFY